MRIFTSPYRKVTSSLSTWWRRVSIGHRSRAKKAAEGVTLIHVTKADTFTTFAPMLLEYPHTLYVTGEHSSEWTHYAENELGLEASVYFYAGVARAMPFGGVTLVFGPECSAQHTGSATVFDTGKVAHGELELNLPKGDTRRAFVQRNLIPLRHWVKGFRKHINENFSDPSQYFDGKPCVPGPNELFSLNEDNASARCYEVRFHEGQCLFDVLEWSGPPTLVNLLKKAKTLAALTDADLIPRLKEFVERAIIPQGTAHGQEIIDMQRRARERMHL